jgi:hypothetical protein
VPTLKESGLVKRPLAEREFDCVDPSGTRFRSVVRIGPPVDHPREGNLSGYSTCDLSIEPLASPISVGGDDSFQALCLSIHVVRSVLKGFAASGGRVFDAGTNAAVDLDNPSFCALPVPDQLWRGLGGKRGRKTGRRARASTRRRT